MRTKNGNPNRKMCFLGLTVIVLFVCFILHNHGHNNWSQFPTNGEIFLSPITNNNSVVFGNNLGDVYSINKKTGSLQWMTKLNTSDIQKISTIQNKIIIIDRNGNLLCLSTKNGKEVWNFSAENQSHLLTYYRIDRQLLFANDVNGTIYAIDLNNGTVRWKFSSQKIIKDEKSPYGVDLNGKLEIYEHILYFASPDGYIYAIQSSNGHIKWKVLINSFSSVTLQLQHNTLYVGKDNGEILAINYKNGQILNTFSTGNQPIICFKDASLFEPLTKLPFIRKIVHAYKYPLLAITKDGKFTSLTLNLQQTDTFYDQKNSISSCPIVINNIGFISTDNDITVVDLMKKTVIWNHKASMISSATSIVDNQLLISNNDGRLQSIDVYTGKINWTYKALGQIFSRPLTDNQNLFFTSSGGLLTRISLPSGNTHNTIPKIAFSNQIRTIGTNNILEISLQFDESFYPNPWNQIKVYLEAYHPNTGTHLNVRGFYYDKNTWKIRFNPPKKGTWNLIETITFPDSRQMIHQDTIDSKTSTEETYIKISKEYPTKFTLDNKSEFPLTGFQSAVTVDSQGEISIGNKALSEFTITSASPSSQAINLSEYLREYSADGTRFNTFRFGINNASFNIFDNFFVGVRPIPNNAKAIDELFENLQNNSMHIWMSLFSFWLPETTSNIEQSFFLDYVDYVVARYGAYVDVWEIGNEVKISDETANKLSQRIRENDNEKRPITISWEKPQLASIDIISAHNYQSDYYKYADINIRNLIEPFTKYEKPIVFSELGNKNNSWEINSKDRMRVKSYTAFFTNASIIYWAQSDSKSYHSEVFQNGNIYIGPDEREQIAVLNKFSQGIPLTSKRFQFEGLPNQTRAYGLETDSYLMGYIVCGQPKRFTTLTLSTARKGKVEWFNPETGKIIETTNYTSLTKQIKSPQCSLDLAFKMTF